MGGSTGVPSSGVSAVAVSVTATNRDVANVGAVKVYPGGPSQPAATETIWSAGASVGSNQAIVPIGQGNQIVAEVFAGRADVQLDIVGWFDDGTPASAAGGLRYQPQVGERIADTRYGFGGPLVAGVTRQFGVLGRGGIPTTGVGAVAVQLHAIESGPARFKVWATGDPEPADTAALVLASGADQRSALMFVKVGTGGTINVKSTGASNLILDAMGYFVTSTTAGAGFQPLTPQRIYDSRLPANGGAKINDVDIRVTDGPGVGAVLVNVIAVDAGGPAIVDTYPSGEPTNNFDTLLVNGAAHFATSSLAFVRPSADGRIHINVWPVSAHIVVDLVGYTGSAATTGFSTDNVLTNGSFEVGTNPWGTNTACGDAAGAISFTTVTGSATNLADQGTAYARIASTSATAAGSVCQNVNRSAVPPKAGERYTLKFKVRSDPGQPAGRGMLELWELGNAPTSVNVQQPFITSSTWTEQTLTMCASNSANFTLRTKIYPYGTVPVDIDNVWLTIINDPACQLFNGVPTVADLNNVAAAPPSNMNEGNFSDVALIERWGNCRAPAARYQNALPVGLANFAWYPGPAFGSRSGYMATNVSVVGGNRACRDWQGAPLNGATPHVFTVWVKSQDGTQVPSVLEMVGHVRQFDPTCAGGTDVPGCGTNYPAITTTSFVANAQWQQITVRWWPPNLTQGAGTYPDTFSVAVVPQLAGKTLLFDEATETGPIGVASCSTWSYVGCGSAGGGGGGVVQEPIYPPLEDGIPGRIHDPSFTKCLTGTGSAVILTSTSPETNCDFFIPHLVAGGLMLKDSVDGCVTRFGNSLAINPCSGVSSQVFQDRLEAWSGNLFSLRHGTDCLQHSPQLAFLPCVEGQAGQIWADGRKLPNNVFAYVYASAPYGKGGGPVPTDPLVMHPSPALPLAIGMGGRTSRGFIEPYCLFVGGYCEVKTIANPKPRNEAAVQVLAIRALAHDTPLGKLAWGSGASAGIIATGVEWETTVPASSGIPQRRADITRSLNVDTSTLLIQYTPFDVYEVKYIDEGSLVAEYRNAIGQLEDYTVSGPFSSVSGLQPIMPGARRGTQLSGWVGIVRRPSLSSICVWAAKGGVAESWSRSWPSTGQSFTGQADGKGVILGTPLRNVSKSNWDQVRSPTDITEAQILQKCSV